MSKRIEMRAMQALHDTDCHAAPVPIERVAKKLGLDLEAAEFGDDVSGLLVLAGNKGKIGYNREDALVRQRFTIAHEIGHYILHAAQSDLFIDRSFIVHHRDSSSARGVRKKEIEANQFAAAILMPADLVASAVAEYAFDLGDEHALSELARKFAVSSQAMSIRLGKLGLLP